MADAKAAPPSPAALASSQELRRYLAGIDVLATALEMGGLSPERERLFLAAAGRIRRALAGTEPPWLSVWRIARSAAHVFVPADVPEIEALAYRTSAAVDGICEFRPEVAVLIETRREQLREVIRAAGRGRGRRTTLVRSFRRLAQELGLQPPAGATLRSEMFRSARRPR